MKVSYFHLMPYQDLPRDFESRYHSAWVDLPNEHFDSAKGGQYYKDYLAQLQHADQLGFDGICVNEPPRQCLWPDALSEPDGEHPDPDHIRCCAHSAGQ